MASSILCSSELFGFFLLLEPILFAFSRFRKLSTRFLSLLSHPPRIPAMQAASKSRLREAGRAEAEMLTVSREDVELVMEKMGLREVGDGENMKEYLNSEEISAIFEEEPSLEEVKAAFSVFDENGDGFVDAGELQRVLCKLGFAERMALDSCEEMISLHDGNGDGMIDFGEFVKFMESSFCR
ncbi:putative calcium-binding protein CML30 [Apostasia shenzhenica]|uniref:Putative calcium-binding protein CML30 n=1 Tax=Apostasia shenzhenica TaxID=1088818 RepID=A0A2H9ZV04_9ASPA|nr:putative calcium-binding protein CML30 [Apostasia shenzhenica]